MAQSQNELDTIRQRARQAVEYYKRQNNPGSTEDGSKSSHPSSPANAYHPSLERDGHLDHYDRVGGHVSQKSSVEDIIHAGVAPPTSNSFYRAKMKAGIIDLRSSYNETIGTRQRSRTFHGPHTGRVRTQTYAVDPVRAKPTATVVGKPQEQNKSKPQVTSPTSPPGPQQYHQSYQHPMPATSRVGGTRRNSRGLYRSNSNLEVDSIECIEDDLPVPSSIHREYGSTSSLDLLAATASQDNYVGMLKDFKNGTVGQPRLRQLLRSEKLVNGSNTDKDEESSEHGKQKSKSKQKERKTRAKSITGDTSASILKKLRGGSKHEGGDTKLEDKCNDDLMSEDKLRQKAFVHFDCQSIGVRLSRSGHPRASGFMKNITTGASAASGKRFSYAVSGDKDLSDLDISDDAGDGKSNELVLSCPFFRNELGGEDERIVSLTKQTAHKHLTSPYNSSVKINSNSQTDSAMSSSSFVRHPACCGIAILDSSSSPSRQVLPPLITHRGHIIEYVDHGAYYYRHFFYNYGKCFECLFSAFLCV